MINYQILNEVKLKISDYYNKLLNRSGLKKLALSAIRGTIGYPQETKTLYSKEDGVLLIWAETSGHGAFVLVCYSDFLSPEIKKKFKKFEVLKAPEWTFGKEHIAYVFEEDVDWAVLFYFMPEMREYMNQIFKEPPTEEEAKEVIERYHPELLFEEIQTITEKLSKLKRLLKKDKIMKLNKEIRERIIKETYEAMLDDIIDRYFHPDYIDDELLDETISNLLEEEGLNPEEDIFDEEKDKIKSEVLKKIAD